MDLTPRLVAEVDFREQWRGYSQHDVDDFLERVAVAVGELQEQLRGATERAAQAERRLLERADAEEEIRRTLLLAQRTAVTTVEEARSEAAQIIADAGRVATELVADSQSRIATLEAELAERRASIEAEIAELTTFAERHRTAVRAELTRLVDELDAPLPSLVVPDPPPASPAPVRSGALEVGHRTPTRPPTDAEVTQARADLVEALRRAGVEEFLAAAEGRADAEPEPEGEPTAAEPEPEPVAATGPHDPEGDRVGTDADEPTGQFDALADADADADADAIAAGDVAEPVPIELEEEPEAQPVAGQADDPFLAELRRAITDTEPLGPRDEPYDGPADGHGHAIPSGRFRLRRGR